MTEPQLDPIVRDGWLEYAWRVVNTTEAHLGECRSSFGSPDVPQRHAPWWMRWPGYVGARWKPGRGLLFVGSVHREFDVSRTRRPEPALLALEHEMIDANAAWRSSGRSARADHAYLTATQGAFSAMWRQWPRSRVFEPFAAKLGLDVDEIAWTNLAKCQVFKNDRETGAPLRDRQEDLQTVCQRLYPIGDTIRLLRPRATFIPVLQVGERTALPEDEVLYIYHGLHGTRLGETPTVWTAREAASLLAQDTDRPGRLSPKGPCAPDRRRRGHPQ